MDTEKRYPVHNIRDRYIPIRDIPLYYDEVPEDLLDSLIKSGAVHYAELKDPKGTRRVPHVDMLDVLTSLGRDTTLKHLEIVGDRDE